MYELNKAAEKCESNKAHYNNFKKCRFIAICYSGVSMVNVFTIKSPLLKKVRKHLYLLFHLLSWG